MELGQFLAEFCLSFRRGRHNQKYFHIIMQKSICVDLFAHKRVRNLGQAERFRVRDAHTPLVSKEDWREVKNRVSMPDREAVILEDITGEGVLAELHPIQFKEDVDI